VVTIVGEAETVTCEIVVVATGAALVGNPEDLGLSQPAKLLNNASTNRVKRPTFNHRRLAFLSLLLMQFSSNFRRENCPPYPVQAKNGV